MYHVVIVGGGHNGVIAATLLARAGLRVALVEKNYSLGGLAGGYFLYGVPASRYAYALGLIPAELEELLGLFGPGDLWEPDPSWVELDEDGSILVRWWEDRGKLVEELAERTGARDIGELFDAVEEFWHCYKGLGLYYTPTPPSPGQAITIMDGRCGERAVEFLENSAATILGWYLPREFWDLIVYPSMFYSNGFVVAYYLQRMGVWRLPSRGMTVLASRLYWMARGSGVDLYTGMRAKALFFENGAARGIILDDGHVVRGRAVLFAAPVTGLLDLEGYEHLGDLEIRRIESMREYKLPIKRIDYYLEGLPRPPREEGWRGTPIYVYWTRSGGGDYTYYHGDGRRYSLVQVSGYPSGPFNPPPPGVEEKQVVHVEERGWKEQEKCCANYTGHPDHLPMTNEYLFDKRPLPGWGGYRTSIPGLYHGSASSYPGGEITGVPGVNAALRILVDMGLEEKAEEVRRKILGLALGVEG